MVDLLANWLERGLFKPGRKGAGAAALTLEDGSTPRLSALPAPLHTQNRLPAPDGVCYSFGERRKARSAISQRMRNLDWSTAQCRGNGGCQPLNHTVCPKSSARPSASPGFSYCHRALSGKGVGGKKEAKVSPGALALLPGAQLEFTPDTRLLSSGARADPQARLQAGLEYLVSYEGMGRAVLRCESSCVCREQRLDAHRTSAVHNESYFIRHFFHLRGNPIPDPYPSSSPNPNPDPNPKINPDPKQVPPTRAGSRCVFWASHRAPGTSSRSAHSSSPPAIAARSGFTIINKETPLCTCCRSVSPSRQRARVRQARRESLWRSSTAARLHVLLPAERSRMPKALPKTTTY